MADLKKHYQSLFKKHGPRPEAVQYSDFETQIARFQILTQIDPHLTSVLDVGCGLGDLWAFLRSNGDESKYLGLDNVPEFVDYANSRFDDNSLAMLVDNLEELPTGYDYSILSGVFNNKMEDNWAFMTKTLRKMYEVSLKGISFNAMSTYVDYFDPDLYYVDPVDVWKFCKKELGGHPVLRHDYSLRKNGFPYEFAVYVYKFAQPSGGQ